MSEVQICAIILLRKKEMLPGERVRMQMRGRNVLTPMFILPHRKQVRGKKKVSCILGGGMEKCNIEHTLLVKLMM